MGVLSWFRRPSELDYETVLSALEARIKTREDHLLSIRLRERRANALFITYGIGAWLVYSIVWYFILRHREDGFDKIIGVLPVIALPVVIIFTRKFMRWWFGRQQEKEATALRGLKKEQQDKVEELKSKTGYYSTRNLLEKYDEGTKKTLRGPLGTPGPGQNKTPAGTPGPSQSSTPARPGTSAANTPHRAISALSPPMPPTMPGPAGSAPQLPLLPPALSSPAPRTLLDKLADALLGVSNETAPHNKYALICANCFSHNGLVVKEEWDTIQYRCPRCGYFNPRRKHEEESESDKPGHRRRVKSVHVTHMRRHDSDTDVRRSGSELDMVSSSSSPTAARKSTADPVMGVGPDQNDSSTEAKEILMTEKKDAGRGEERPRRRGAGARAKKLDEDADAMDTDP